MQYQAGHKIWVRLPWVDDDCAVWGEFISETAKRYKINCEMRGGVVYVLKSNIYPREG